MRPKDILDDEFMRKIEQLRLVSRKIIVGRIRGERLTRKRGQSVEFADYRHYVAGDDLRFLDWNLYARLDRLFLKLFLEEEDLHVHILLDASRSMDYGQPTKFDYARKLTAALAYIALANYDRVVLATVADGRFDKLGPLRGKHQLLRLLQFLADLEPKGETALSEPFRQFALTERRRGVVLIVSDLMDKSGCEDALRYFIATNQDVFIIHVLAKEEVAPELVGDLRLVDMEDADTAEISVSRPLLSAYRRRLEGFMQDIKTYAGSRGMSYLPAPTSVPFDKLILDYMRRRGVLQ